MTKQFQFSVANLIWAVGWIAIGCVALSMWEQLEIQGVLAETAISFLGYVLGGYLILIATPVAVIAALFGRNWIGFIMFAIIIAIASFLVVYSYAVHNF